MSIAEEKAALAALQNFADAVTAKMTSLTAGEPEDQLRKPFEVLMEEIGKAISRKIVCAGEVRLPGRLGKPDFAVHAGKLLAGYAELKAPGTGVNPGRFTGRNRDQWKRFSVIPNLIYCDGNDWALYRDGKSVRPIVRLSGDVATNGKDAVELRDAQSLFALLMDFLSWEPIIPTTQKGEIDLKGLAALLAPLCRMVRQDVTDALQDPRSPLVQLAEDWRQLLFPDASDEQFADAYAQTVTFALLLARSEGADPLTLASAEAALAAAHTLLSRALQVLTDPDARAEISASVELLLRVIGTVPPSALTGPKEPWLYFYEDFLAVYDPKLRKDIGAYYTPVEVVHCQVRLIDELLTNRLGKALGFADRGVVTLDPAAGTGTYLLGVIEHALNKVQAQQGPGAVQGKATALAKNIYGFEIMVGPFAVSELRISRALEDKGAKLPADGTHIYLTDTLESPHNPPPALPYYLKPIADQHARALKVKIEVPVIVCLGNPPYDRHEAADPTNLARTGGWVRYGDLLKPAVNSAKRKRIRDPQAVARAAMKAREQHSILYKAFLKPAIDAGHGGDLKNAYNLYVYFWRWALWKVFEGTSTGSGVVSFISAASYLDGDAFCGMREHMRRICDEVWILDIGGEGRGTRKSENVFAIQTPVAIAVAVRYGRAEVDRPAKVHFARIEAPTQEQKLKALDAIDSFTSLQWQDCPREWHSPFRPVGTGRYFDWALLTDLFPWQHSGVKAGRTWVIAPDANTLKQRWAALCDADKEKRAALFKESPTGHKVHDSPNQLPPVGGKLKPIFELPRHAPPPAIVRYAFRSLDRQYTFFDARLLDRPSPALWGTHSDRQLYLTTLLNHPLGQGPALTVAADIPDLHHFRGSFGAKEVLPLYRDAECHEPNVAPGLLDVLAKAYGRPVTPEDFAAYVYGLLAHAAFTERFENELATREIRVPITRDAVLFDRVRDIGARLLWLHTYGQRCVPRARHRGLVPKGKARCNKPVSGDAADYPYEYDYNEATKILRVGPGEFAPVEQPVYNFNVSGLQVVQSWLGYRMESPKGRKSSALDDIRPERWTADFTTELLELLWILEATIAEYPAQAELLAEIVQKRTIRV